MISIVWLHRSAFASEVLQQYFHRFALWNLHFCVIEMQAHAWNHIFIRWQAKTPESGSLWVCLFKCTMSCMSLKLLFLQICEDFVNATSFFQFNIMLSSYVTITVVLRVHMSYWSSHRLQLVAFLQFASHVLSKVTTIMLLALRRHVLF